jgi:hypothetical protein
LPVSFRRYSELAPSLRQQKQSLKQHVDIHAYSPFGKSPILKQEKTLRPSVYGLSGIVNYTPSTCWEIKRSEPLVAADFVRLNPFIAWNKAWQPDDAFQSQTWSTLDSGRRARAADHGAERDRGRNNCRGFAAHA